MSAPSLWHHRGFLLLWGGQTVSEVGSAVTAIALPLLAVTTLGASTFEVALLSAASSAAFLLIALQAGALVDRWRRKRVLVRADLLRAAVLATLPAAQLLGVLSLGQLYAVALATSVLTVFFDVAYQSFLPALVPREQLNEGNAKLTATGEIGRVAGPGVGGALVAAVGAALAVGLDALSFLVSAALTARIEDPEAQPSPRVPGARLRTEIREGLAYVAGHPVLSRVVGCTATINLASAAIGALEVVYLVRVLGASATVVGLVFGLGAVGGVVGAVAAGPLARAVGSARIIWVVIAAEAPFAFATPLASPGWGVLLVSVSVAAGGFVGVVYNVAQVSYRQTVTPRRLLGRMNASIRFVVWGVTPLGALAGGGLATVIGVRPTLFVAAGVGALAVLWLLASPLRSARDLADLPGGLGVARD